MTSHLDGGAGTTGAPGPTQAPAPGPAPAPGSGQDDRGSQSVEFALVLPLVFVLLGLVLQAGVFGADLVATQGLAREAARAAAVSDDSQVRERVRSVAGGRPVRLELDPPSGRRAPGDLVSARLEVRSRAFEPVGVDVWLPGTATMLVEDTGSTTGGRQG